MADDGPLLDQESAASSGQDLFNLPVPEFCKTPTAMYAITASWTVISISSLVCVGFVLIDCESVPGFGEESRPQALCPFIIVTHP